MFGGGVGEVADWVVGWVHEVGGGFVLGWVAVGGGGVGAVAVCRFFY